MFPISQSIQRITGYLLRPFAVVETEEIINVFLDVGITTANGLPFPYECCFFCCMPDFWALDGALYWFKLRSFLSKPLTVRVASTNLSKNSGLTACFNCNAGTWHNCLSCISSRARSRICCEIKLTFSLPCLWNKAPAYIVITSSPFATKADHVLFHSWKHVISQGLTFYVCFVESKRLQL